MNKKQKQLFKMTAIAALATASIAPVAQAVSFSDLANNPYKEEIIALADRSIISGYPNGTFQPNKVLTRSDVVKLLGKYLVSLGYKVPADYKTKMRFTDLTANSSEELLKYAAVVKDAGVFVGSNGQLLHTQQIKREHMALVLVRAFSKINNFDYVSYVNGKTFIEEYLDKETLTSENAVAVRVFDFYDISIEDYFRPKASAVRGEFASAFYKMMQLERIEQEKLYVQHVDVISADRLTVTLSNGTKHNVRLEDALSENVAERVTFTILGNSYSATVTYQVQELQVQTVRNINSAQFVVYFNQPVNLATTYKQSDLAKVFTLQQNKTKNNISLLKGELSDDKRSFKITIDSSTALTNDTYRLIINGVHAVNGTSLPAYDDVFTFVKDNMAPRISGVENLGKSKVKIYFSEPVNLSSYSVQYKTKENNIIYGITTNASRNMTELELNLSQATVAGRSLAEGQTVYAIFTRLADLANNVSTDVTTQFTKVQPDSTKPRVIKVQQLGAKQFKISFSEPMSLIRPSQLTVTQQGERNYIEEIKQIEDDSTSFVVTTKDFLEKTVRIFTSSGQNITDTSGESATIYQVVTFDYDTTAPTVVRTEVTREQNSEYLDLHFDRNVNIASNATLSITGSYVINGVKNYIQTPKTAKVYADEKNPTVIRVLLSELVSGIDRENAKYTVTPHLTNVTNEYGIAANTIKPILFTRGKDFAYNNNKLKVLSIETSRTSSEVENSKRILVNFNYDVDIESATDLNNYEFDGWGWEIVSAKVYATNLKQVELLLANDIPSATERYLSIKDIRAKDAITRMESYYGSVLFNESFKPLLQSTTGVMIGNKTQLSQAVLTGTNEMTLTFNEAVQELPSDSFIVMTQADEALTVSTAVHKTDKTKVILTFSQPLKRGNTLTIQLKPNRTITDLYGNASSFRLGVITIY